MNQFESHMVRALESISEFGGRADRLNMYNVYTGDPGYLTKDFDRYLEGRSRRASSAWRRST